ncbi:MAG: hypothetical protein KAH72_04215 [Flavobacteriaceae bacterium]|nr:hypothetical protein [Flavobacteriaceae bacterium]
MEYLGYYGVGIIIWFVLSIFKSGVMLQNKNTWGSLKEAMLWPVELIYLFGTFINVFTIVTYNLGVQLRENLKQYNIKKNVEKAKQAKQKKKTDTTIKGK